VEPRRVFLGREQPLLEAVSGRLLHRSTPARDGAAIDLRGLLLLLPGKRAVRLLRQRLVEDAAEQGRGVLLPKMVTPQQFRSTLCRERRRIATPLETHLAWNTALEAASPKSRSLLLPVDLTISSPAIARLAQRLDRLARTLAEERIPLENPARMAESSGATEDFARLKFFEALGEDVAQRLLRVERSTEFQLAEEEFEDPGQVIAIGLFDPRGRVRELLQRLRHLEVWIYGEESESDRFDHHGSLQSPLPSEDPLQTESEGAVHRSHSFPDENFWIARDPAEAVRLAVEKVERARNTGQSPSICVLDRELKPLIVDRLQRRGFRVHDNASRSVLLTSPGRFITALRTLLEEEHFSALAAFLRHPNVEVAAEQRLPTSKSGASLLKLVDELSATSLPGRWKSLPDRAEWLRHCIAPWVDRFLGPAQPVARWAEHIAEQIDRTFPGEEETPAIEMIHSAIAELAAIPDRLADPRGAVEALRLLEGQLAEHFLPLQTEEGAIELIGWLEAEFDPSPSLIVIGANEGTLPTQSSSIDPLLSRQVCRALHLDRATEQLTRDAWIVHNLLQGQKQVTWISSRQSLEGEGLHPTRFWLEEESTRTERVRRFYGETSAPAISSPLLPSQDEGPALALPTPHQPDPPITRVSVTGLGEYLQCPYTFYLRRVLKLKEVNDHSDELDPLHFGNRIHHVLEALGREKSLLEVDDAEQITAFLDETLAAHVHHTHGSHPSAVVRIQHEQMSERLSAFADWQANSVRDGWRIYRVEEEIPARSPNFPISDDLIFTLTGIIDRIDLHEDGRRVRIIDYKTGEQGTRPRQAHQKGRGQNLTWKSLQLPLYRHFLPLLGIERAETEVGFVLLPRNPSEIGFAAADWREEDFEHAISTAKEALTAIHRGIFGPPKRLSSPWDKIFAGEEGTGASTRLTDRLQEDSPTNSHGEGVG